MTDDHQQALAMEGIRFFGEISASISHEIKNVLAIVNENAGLLEDMVRMSEQGAQLAPERVSRAALSIMRQVTRGDRIIKNMNRFAHSADLPREDLDIREVVDFIPELTARLVAMRGSAPLVSLPEAAVTLYTNRFFLENLVWACLRRAMGACLPGESLRIAVEATETGACIRFGGLNPETLAEPSEDFPGPRERPVIEILGARIINDPEKGEICLIIR